MAFLFLLCLCGCVAQTGEDPVLPEQSVPKQGSSGGSSGGGESQQENNEGAAAEPYQAPAFADSVFHEEAAVGEKGVLFDLSATAEGYIGVAAQCDGRLKFQALMGESTYTYNLPGDGSAVIFPLQCGNGDYTFRVMQEVSEGKYAQVYEAGAAVALADEFQPFLRPSQYVNYNAESQCVRKAGEIAASQSDALGVVEAVFDFICDSVTYDKELAKSVEKTYLPDPDHTLASGKGICFDYASLAAAMLRSQGIPTKMVFGYVQPDDLYHAWNMFYTQESGWVAVEYEVESNSWNRLDATFAANGSDAEFIGDGTNYTDVYYY